jgi:hypothetical protein
VRGAMAEQPAAAVAAAEAKMRALMSGGAAERAEQAQRRRRELLESMPVNPAPPLATGSATTPRNSGGGGGSGALRPGGGGALRPGGGGGGLRPGGMMRPPSKPAAAKPPPSLLALSDRLVAQLLSHVDAGNASALANCRLTCKRLCGLADRAVRQLRHQPRLESLLETDTGARTLAQLLGRWPGLQTIDVSTSFAVSDSHLRVLPMVIRAGLVSLCISHCWGVTHLWPAAAIAAAAQPEPEPEPQPQPQPQIDATAAAAAAAMAAAVHGGLPSLRSLSAHGCEGLSDLSGLRFSTELTSLDVGACAGITDLSVLAELPSLTQLNLEGCGALDDRSIALVGGIRSLQLLNVSWCRRLTDVTALSGCARLKEVLAVGTRLQKGGLDALRAALGESVKVQLTEGLRRPAMGRRR